MAGSVFGRVAAARGRLIARMGAGAVAVRGPRFRRVEGGPIRRVLVPSKACLRGLSSCGSAAGGHTCGGVGTSMVTLTRPIPRVDGGV